MHTITLLTDRANDAAIRFYQRHGFGMSGMMPLWLKFHDAYEYIGSGGFVPTLKKSDIKENIMKISARNIFQGKITEIKPGSVNSEVDVTLGGDDKIVAIITNGSVQRLGLIVGKAVTALIKASSVLVLTDGSDITLSTRNVLAGKVAKLSNGPVSSEVAIVLPSGATVYAVITHDAVNELGIKEGLNASAVFKASSVILGVAS
ncbi:MAG: TOBE domain-containing protein [Gallionellaceae bacterium]